MSCYWLFLNARFNSLIVAYPLSILAKGLEINLYKNSTS